MRLSIKLLDYNQAIQQKILKALLPDCKKAMNNAMSYMKNNLPIIIQNAIFNSPEYVSLVSGTLRLELGIPDASSKINGLINTWISNIVYDVKPPAITSKQIIGKFTVRAIKSDFSDVLGSNYAYVMDNLRGYSLPWLEWLLLDGSKTIISSYDVFFGPNPRSRTGGAVMKLSTSGWKISEFSGTQDNNWITRALDTTSQDVENLLQKAFA